MDYYYLLKMVNGHVLDKSYISPSNLEYSKENAIDGNWEYITKITPHKLEGSSNHSVTDYVDSLWEEEENKGGQEMIKKGLYYDFGDGLGHVPAHRHMNPDGSLGGWVAETAHVDSTCYIGYNALVYGCANVFKNSAVYNFSKVCGNAWVLDNSGVFDRAVVSQNARISCGSRIYGSALIAGDVRVFNRAKVSQRISALENVVICDGAEVNGDAKVSGDAFISGFNTRIEGKAKIKGKSKIYNNNLFQFDFSYSDFDQEKMEELFGKEIKETERVEEKMNA
jgi:carbonic anhydrase/acetyltransferase-like protein (isoleucine patch superfamily)